MTEATAIRGVISYPITPFRPDTAEIDVPALRGLVDRLVLAGSHGIAPLGSTGESAYLNDQEWHTVAEHTIDAVRSRVPTVVGISDLTTASAVRRARAAKDYGATAVMLLPISYWKLSERELVTHFGAVADSVDVPIMVYNNPATSGIDMSPEFLVRLVERFDNITMIKESSGDIRRMQRIWQLTDGRLPFFNGSNPLVLQALTAGAAGWCTAAPCLVPQNCLALWEAAQAGDLDRARGILRDLLSFLEFIVQGGLPTTIKAGLKLRGFDAGVPREPLLELDDADTKELVALLNRADQAVA